MKKIFVTLAVLSVSLIASARSIDTTAVVAVVSGYEQGLKQIALLADGRLQVVANNGKVSVVQLSKSALSKLENLAEGLSSAEIKEDTRTIVCKMMVRPTLSDLSVNPNYDSQKGEFQGNSTRLILTASSCALSHVVYPVNDYDQQDAGELKTALVVLGLNTVK
jgi:hypothetical protein